MKNLYDFDLLGLLDIHNQFLDKIVFPLKVRFLSFPTPKVILKVVL